MAERVVYVSGVWDLFHVGHLNIIEEASRLGDKLVVGVVAEGCDVERRKHPIIPFEQRCAIVGALRCVDAVEPYFDNDTYPILKYNVTTRVVGPEWLVRPRNRELATEMLAMGCKVVIVPQTPGVSTTLIKERIRKEEE